jgi:hypothetical protein
VDTAVINRVPGLPLAPPMAQMVDFITTRLYGQCWGNEGDEWMNERRNHQ